MRSKFSPSPVQFNSSLVQSSSVQSSPVQSSPVKSSQVQSSPVESKCPTPVEVQPSPVQVKSIPVQSSFFGCKIAGDLRGNEKSLSKGRIGGITSVALSNTSTIQGETLRLIVFPRKNLHRERSGYNILTEKTIF